MRPRRSHPRVPSGGSDLTSAGRNHFRRRLLVGAVALVALAGIGIHLRGGLRCAHRRGSGRSRPARQQKPAPAPDFGPNVTIFDPTRARRLRSRRSSTRSTPPRSTTRWAPERYGLYFMPGTYGTAEEPLQVKVGYYTEVAGPGRLARRRADQRRDRGLQPLLRRSGRPRVHRLLRAEQLLARPVEPHASTSTPLGQDGCTRLRQLLGRLPGGVDASRGRQAAATSSLMDYCTAARPSPAAGSSPTRAPAGVDRSTAPSSSGTRATARSASGPTRCGTRCSRVDFAGARAGRRRLPRPAVHRA